MSKINGCHRSSIFQSSVEFWQEIVANKRRMSVPVRSAHDGKDRQPSTRHDKAALKSLVVRSYRAYDSRYEG